MSEVKSCLNCKHIKTWYDCGSSEQPSDSGWECNHPNYNDFLYEEPEDSILTDDDKFAQYCASDCPGYEYFDWNSYHEQQAIAEAELERQLAAAERQLGIDQYFVEHQLEIDAERHQEFTEGELRDMAELQERIANYGFDFSWE